MACCQGTGGEGREAKVKIRPLPKSAFFKLSKGSCSRDSSKLCLKEVNMKTNIKFEIFQYKASIYFSYSYCLCSAISVPS